MSQQLGTPTLPSSRQALGLVSFHPAAGVGHHEESGAVPCLLTSQPLEQCDGSRVLGHLRARATRAHNQSAVTIATVAAFFSISCVLLHSTLVDRSAPPGSQTWFLEHKGHKAPTSVPCMPCCPIQKSSTQLRNIRPSQPNATVGVAKPSSATPGPQRCSLMQIVPFFARLAPKVSRVG